MFSPGMYDSQFGTYRKQPFNVFLSFSFPFFLSKKAVKKQCPWVRINKFFLKRNEASFFWTCKTYLLLKQTSFTFRLPGWIISARMYLLYLDLKPGLDSTYPCTVYFSFNNLSLLYLSLEFWFSNFFQTCFLIEQEISMFPRVETGTLALFQ